MSYLLVDMRAHVILDSMKSESQSPTLEVAMSQFMKLICQSLRRIEEARTSGNEAVWENVSEEEPKFIEAMTGSALVLCQVYIVRVASLVARLGRIAKDRGKPQLLPLKDKDAIKLNVRPIPGTSYTLASAINVFADFFKHRDQWPYDWAKIDKKENPLAYKTKEAIGELGLKKRGADNLSKALDAIGCKNYSLYQLATELHQWNEEIRQYCVQKMKSEGFLQRQRRLSTTRP